jgi:hypothetical protein
MPLYFFHSPPPFRHAILSPPPMTLPPMPCADFSRYAIIASAAPRAARRCAPRQRRE